MTFSSSSLLSLCSSSPFIFSFLMVAVPQANEDRL
jgi:hypothetical protein